MIKLLTRIATWRSNSVELDLCKSTVMRRRKSRIQSICDEPGFTKSPGALNDLLKEILQAKLSPKVIFNNSLIPD